MSGLVMEATPRVPILNRKDTKAVKAKQANNKNIEALVNGLANNHDFLGPLTIDKVVVSRKIHSEPSK